jgi:hypothetical protein
MAGVPGAGGPVPKRSDQRRRRNKTEPVTKAPGVGGSKPPPANSKWHPVARRWFQSLKNSGQARFYEPSDWATAFLLAESISRELQPQPIGNTEDGDVIYASLPPKGASLAAWLKAMTSLLVTEGDRRRARLELEAAPPADPAEEAAVADLDDYRKRLAD